MRRWKRKRHLCDVRNHDHKITAEAEPKRASLRFVFLPSSIQSRPGSALLFLLLQYCLRRFGTGAASERPGRPILFVVSFRARSAMARTFIFLGTGTSVGIPMVGCDCPVCRSSNPKNQRYRCAVLIKSARGNLLIDTPPELRLQLLRENVGLVHAVLFTHFHADHVYGLDDVRPFPRKLGGPAESRGQWSEPPHSRKCR
jgi:hypothetical protein